MDSVFTVYRTVNEENGRFYIGVHKTCEPDDEYLGSGKWLRWSITKYGRDKFHKEILHIFNTSEEAYAKEAELVSVAKVDSNCMNLTAGGSGGWEYTNRMGLNIYSPDQRPTPEAVIKGHEKLSHLLMTNATFRQKFSANVSMGLRKLATSDHAEEYWLTKSLGQKRRHARGTPTETRQRMSLSHSGALNNRFGYKWVTNGIDVKSIPAAEFESYINNGWYPGRCIATIKMITVKPTLHEKLCQCAWCTAKKDLQRKRSRDCMRVLRDRRKVNDLVP